MNGHSALYEGRVTHRRHVPHAHGFSYRMARPCGASRSATLAK